MRDKMIAVAVIVATELLAGCAPRPPTTGTVTYKVGNVTYNNETDYLAATQRQSDGFVAQVGPAPQRLGGTLILVLPTTATIRQIWTKVQAPNFNLNEILAETGEINLVADAMAVEKGQAFDSVRIVRADSPEAATFDDGTDAEYLLRYTTKNKWNLTKRSGGTSDVEQPTIKNARVEWLNAFNIAVLNAAADLGAKVTRQALPTGTGATVAATTGTITGTAFFVNATGYAVTNAHVVPNCKAVKVALGDGRKVEATVAAKDVPNDLAVLLVPSAPAGHARVNGTLPRQGDSVVTYGFPLAGALSTQGNISTGIISSLSGLANDSRTLQISAPVQPGNSGGPLLDLDGDVVGVVTSKINTLKLAAATGDIAQNINFAIKSSILLGFLESNGIAADTGSSKKPLQLPDVGDRARTFTYMVTCER